MSEEIVTVQQLSRVFGRTVALADVTLSVARGTVFGLVGENGAGKTTLIKHLLGLHRPESASVRVFGLDPVRDPVGVLGRIGYLSEDRDLPDWMRVGELMSYTRAFYPRWDDGLGPRTARDVRTRHRPEDPHVVARPAGAGRAAGRPGPSAGLAAAGRTFLRPRSCGPAGHSGGHRADGGRRGADGAALVAPAARGPAGGGPGGHAAPRAVGAERAVGRPARPAPLADGALRQRPGSAAGIGRGPCGGRARATEWTCLCNGQWLACKQAAEAAGATIVEERLPSLEEVFLARTKGVAAGSSQP